MHEISKIHFIRLIWIKHLFPCCIKKDINSVMSGTCWDDIVFPVPSNISKKILPLYAKCFRKNTEAFYSPGTWISVDFICNGFDRLSVYANYGIGKCRKMISHEKDDIFLMLITGNNDERIRSIFASECTKCQCLYAVVNLMNCLKQTYYVKM
jgi:hypothetical protein